MSASKVRRFGHVQLGGYAQTPVPGQTQDTLKLHLSAGLVMHRVPTEELEEAAKGRKV